MSIRTSTRRACSRGTSRVEQQIGTAWQAAASYLGSYSDRLWGQVAINPGVFLGLGPCTLQRRDLSRRARRRPTSISGACSRSRIREDAQLLGPVDRFDDLGTQDYRGLKLSVRRRAANGVSLSGNYTLSHCVGNIVVERVPADQRRLPQAGRSDVRSRQLPAEPHADRQR